MTLINVRTTKLYMQIIGVGTRFFFKYNSTIADTEFWPSLSCQLKKIMLNLTPEQKAVITIRLRDKVSVRAIAAELNINKHTVLKTQPNFL
jgi:DNA-binding MarR family transcriptional regulator